MTKSELKKIIKPMVKECLKDMLLEEGLLSNLIGEVLKGQKSVIPDNPTQQIRKNNSDKRSENFLRQSESDKKQKLEEARRKIREMVGGGGSRENYSYNEKPQQPQMLDVFENLEPAPNPDDPAANSDPGIDLSILSKIPGLKNKF